jgi:hypothetical protein
MRARRTGARRHRVVRARGEHRHHVGAAQAADAHHGPAPPHALHHGHARRLVLAGVHDAEIDELLRHLGAGDQRRQAHHLGLGLRQRRHHRRIPFVGAAEYEHGQGDQ